MKSSHKKILAREKDYWDSQEAFEWLSEQGIQSVLDVIPPVQGDVLGLCSGSGMFPKRIPVQYNRYISLDLSQPLLLKQRLDIPQIIPMVGNAENPALLSLSFDLVLVFAGLHHVPDENKAIHNAYRLLRPGGQFVAFEPNANCWYRKPMLRLKSILNLYTEDERFLIPEEIRDKMKNAGFVDIKIKYLTPEYNPAHLKTFLNKMLSNLIRIAASVNQGPYWQSFFVIVGKR